MKKGIIGSIIIVLIAIVTLPTFASTYTVKITAKDSTQIIRGDVVTFIVSISNIDKEHGVGAISGKIEYNQSVFETIKTDNIDSGEGWGTISFNDIETSSEYGSFVTERSSGDLATADNELMIITAKVKNNATLGNTTIQITNLSASDGNNDLFTEDAVLTLTVKNTSSGDNNTNNNNTNNNNTNNNNTNNNNTNNNNTNNNNTNNNNTNNNNTNNNNTNNNNTNNNNTNNNNTNNNNTNNNNTNNNNTNNNNTNNNNTNNNNTNNNNTNNNTNNSNKNNSNTENKKDNTLANSDIPYAGIKNYIIPTILIICGIAIIFYVRYNKIKND